MDWSVNHAAAFMIDSVILIWSVWVIRTAALTTQVRQIQCFEKWQHYNIWKCPNMFLELILITSVILFYFFLYVSASSLPYEYDFGNNTLKGCISRTLCQPSNIGNVTCYEGSFYNNGVICLSDVNFSLPLLSFITIVLLL